jgi:hypothetical protein
LLLFSYFTKVAAPENDTKKQKIDNSKKLIAKKAVAGKKPGPRRR